jgi:hypothetical protein
MKYDYLPENKMGSYGYTSSVQNKLKSAKKMITLVPNKAKVQEY